MKFLLIAVFVSYPTGLNSHGGIDKIERVEVWGIHKNLSECERYKSVEEDAPIGMQMPGLGFLSCVPLKAQS